MRKEFADNARGSRSREALQAAATRLLDEREVSEVSITEIVKLAGVTRPTFYQAFDDLAELFTAAAAARLDEAFAEISTHPEAPSATSRELMGEAFTTVLRVLAKHETFFKRVLRGPSGSTVLATLTDAVSSRLLTSSPVAAVLANGPIPEKTASSALAAGAVWLFVDWLNAPHRTRPTIATVAVQVRDFVYGSVVGGLASPAPPSTSPQELSDQRLHA